MKEQKLKGAVAKALTATDPNETKFKWEKSLFVGDCIIDAGATLIVRADGTANWIAKARSTDTNDTLSATFYLLDKKGKNVFPDQQIGPITIPRGFAVKDLKMPKDDKWYSWGSGFSYKKSAYAKIASVTISLRG